MSHSIDQEMLDALELFYYSSSFSHRRFLCCFETGLDLSKMLLDLRLLLQAKMEVILILGPDQQRCFPTGYPVVPCQTLEDVKPALANAMMPIITLDTDRRDPWPFDLAKQFGVERVLWVGSEPGILVNGEVVSHLDLEEFEALLTDQPSLALNRYWGQELGSRLEKEGLDWVFVGGEPGALFQEIFTHQGSGTLIARSYQKNIAQANLNDLVDLLFLMRPYVKQGAILPVSEIQIGREIENYWVYRLNGSVVVAARCKEYEQDIELGKFCSLPRYQGKGRAQELVKSIAQTMADQGKRRLFALTIDQRMGDFFCRLGFETIDRNELPETWAEGYDFSRASKGYVLELETLRRTTQVKT